MRRLILIAVAVMATTAATAPGAQAASSKTSGRCDTAKHRFDLGHDVYRLHTVVQTKRVWILHTGRRFGDEFWACWKPTGKATRMGFTSGGADVTDTVLDDIVVSGRYVAFHIGATGDERYDQFRSFDVAAQRQRRNSGKLPATAYAGPTKVVVTSTGALGWLASATLGATDARGTRVLAKPAGGAISGLKASGRKVSWAQAGARHSVTLK